MGTRNLIVAVKDGKVKVAQYCQWDGYFTGQGEDIASFIRTNLAEESTSKQFRENIEKCIFVDNEFMKNIQIECGLDPEQSYVSFGDPAFTRYKERYPQFNRDTGSDIFNLILNGTHELYDDFSFGNDSLWCEYAYVLNLDSNILEIYTGFNKDPIPEDIPEMFRRWSKIEDNDYYPVKLYRLVTFQELWDNPDYMSELATEYYDEDEEVE